MARGSFFYCYLVPFKLFVFWSARFAQKWRHICRKILTIRWQEISFYYSTIPLLDARNLYLACARPEVLDLYSKQGRNLARRAAELSKEDIEKLEARCLKLLKNAADKVLWLNSQCRDYMSEPFIVGYYNKRCVQDCHKLVLDFLDTVPTHEDVRITRLAF